jgi:hypothetical protein
LISSATTAGWTINHTKSALSHLSRLGTVNAFWAHLTSSDGPGSTVVTNVAAKSVCFTADLWTRVRHENLTVA